MIYYLLYELVFNHFKDKDWYLIKALNVFQYVTFRTAYATITALLISLFFGGKLIEALRGYQGTILCASHDEGIIDIATHVYEVDGGGVRELIEKRLDSWRP